MKKFVLPLFAIITLSASAQKVDFSTGYNVDVPVKTVMPKMSAAHGANFHLGFKALKTSPLWLNTDISTSCFALVNRKEMYSFSDGSVTETYVNYSSNLHKFLFGASYDIGSTDRILSGYIKGQAGYAIMNSKIYIEDPNDPDGCKALVNKNTFRYGGGIYSGGAGVRFNIDKIRNRNSKVFTRFIDIGYNYMGGGNFRYVNIKYMQEHQHGISNSSSTPDRGTQDLTTEFVNVTTNDIHEHKIAEIYQSKFEMWNLKISFLMRF